MGTALLNLSIMFREQKDAIQRRYTEARYRSGQEYKSIGQEFASVMKCFVTLLTDTLAHEPNIHAFLHEEVGYLNTVRASVVGYYLIERPIREHKRQEYD